MGRERLLIIGDYIKIAIRGPATSDRELLEEAQATIVNCLQGMNA